MIMNKLKGLILIIVVLGFVLPTSGCYFLSGVESHQVGLLMNDGVKISKVVGPGRYTKWGWFAEKVNIDCSAKTSEWTDPDLWTKDKQPVGLKLVVTYSRKKSTQSIREMWGNYQLEALNDNALAKLVLSRVPRVAKQITTQFTLDEMLGIAGGPSKGREVLQQDMFDILKNELNEFGVELKDVGVSDITADEGYVAKLKEKAVNIVAAEVATQKTLQLKEQLKQEQQQTEVEKEIARRDNIVAAERNKVYAINPQAFQLEKLKLWKDIVGDKDKFWLIQLNSGTDLNLFMNSDGKIVPMNR